MAMASPPQRSRPRLSAAAAAARCAFVLTAELSTAFAADVTTAEDDSNPCLLYIAESTIPNAGLGVFTGVPLVEGQLVGRVGDLALSTVDHDWHNSPESGATQTKHEGDYHWPLINYDWNAPDIGMDSEAESVSVTVNGFGAAPNCHFRLLNIEEHRATYDDAGLDRYTSPGAGAFTPWFNRSSTAAKDIEAGSELFVDYGPNWFTSRELFNLMPISSSFENAQRFLKEYGKLLVGSKNPADLVEDRMALGDEAQKDLWEVIKTFPYATRERQALPDDYRDAVRAIHGDIQAIEKENSLRPLEYLKEHGRCMDNIVPGKSSIPHAGRGAFATRFIAKGGLVAPAPLVHITHKAAANMYNETSGPGGRVVRDESAVVGKQIITNYVFGHPNSTMVLFPYSSNAAYVNHHSTEYNAELRWAKDADWIHKDDWLTKPVEALEDHWTAGLMLEFIALRDIEPGEEVLINYGDDWQKAWDEHVKNWKPIPVESDCNNLTLWAKTTVTNCGKAGYTRSEVMNEDVDTPIRTAREQAADPYPYSVQVMCRVNANHDSAYLFEPETIPFYTRQWRAHHDNPEDVDDRHLHKCNVTERREKDSDDESSDDEEEDEVGSTHMYTYTVELEVVKQLEGLDPIAETHEIYGVPRSAVVFEDVRYSSDVFLKNSFRHEIGLPDEIFPRAWMNLMPKEERE